ncbi:MAG TPA: hypothetical protein VMV29_12915, partial [Ktedonobacterales bacterium]|nr:hypothetical protein [Ktedonobacterales bacterium]
AENARLQHAYDMNETTMNMQDRALKVQHADLANTLAQVTAMRPLVEAVSIIEPGVRMNPTGISGAFDLRCLFCGVELPHAGAPDDAHMNDCTWVAIRALVRR